MGAMDDASEVQKSNLCDLIVDTFPSHDQLKDFLKDRPKLSDFLTNGWPERSSLRNVARELITYCDIRRRFEYLSLEVRHTAKADHLLTFHDDWLYAAELSHNPFPVLTRKGSPELESYLVRLDENDLSHWEQWNSLTSLDRINFWGRHWADADIVATLIKHHFEPSMNNLVICVKNLGVAVSAGSTHAALDRLTTLAADAWFSMLGWHPEIFLESRNTAFRRGIATLLDRSCPGGTPAIQNRVKLAVQQRNWHLRRNQKMIPKDAETYKRLRRELESTQVSSSSSDSHNYYIDLLEAQIELVDGFHLPVIFAPNRMAPLNALKGAIDSLPSKGKYGLKLLANSYLASSGALNSTQLEWSENCLESILEKLTLFASDKSKKNFNNLFDPPLGIHLPSKLLIASANKSLGKLLVNGRRVIMRHLRQQITKPKGERTFISLDYNRDLLPVICNDLQVNDDYVI